MIEEVRGKGQPVLVLDAGDALFAGGKAPSERDLERARLILAGMGHVGTQAMAVGDRDLQVGLDVLRSAAAEAGVPLLSANLLGSDGKPAFTRWRTLDLAGGKVGVFAIHAPAPGAVLPAGLRSGDHLAAAREAIAALQGSSLVIGLVHGPTSAAEAVASLPGVHLVIPGHDGMMRQPYRPAGASAWVVGLGQKGRDLGRLTIELAGQGPLVDAGAAERAAEQVAFLQTRISEARARMQNVPPGSGRAGHERLITTLEGRLAEARRLAEAKPGSGRAFRYVPVPLDEGVPDEPEMAARVKRFEARYPSP